jgi:hypothetical protein
LVGVQSQASLILGEWAHGDALEEWDLLSVLCKWESLKHGLDHQQTLVVSFFFRVHFMLSLKDFELSDCEVEIFE